MGSTRPNLIYVSWVGLNFFLSGSTINKVSPLDTSYRLCLFYLRIKKGVQSHRLDWLFRVFLFTFLYSLPVRPTKTPLFHRSEPCRRWRRSPWRALTVRLSKWRRRWRSSLRRSSTWSRTIAPTTESPSRTWRARSWPRSSSTVRSTLSLPVPMSAPPTRISRLGTSSSSGLTRPPSSISFWYIFPFYPSSFRIWIWIDVRVSLFWICDLRDFYQILLLLSYFF